MSSSSSPHPGYAALADLRRALRAQPTQLPATFSPDRRTITIAPNSSTPSTYPASTLTPYRNLRHKTRAEFYPLDSLVLLLEDAAKSVPHSVIKYLEAAKKFKIEPVSTTQRKDVLAYLRGEIETSVGLDEVAFQSMLDASDAAAQAQESMELADEQSGKRRRLGERLMKPIHEWNVDDIIGEEFPLATHLTVLQAKKSLGHIIELFHKASSARTKAEASTPTSSSKPSSSSSQVKIEKGRPVVVAPVASGGIPIIVVPAAISSIINMYNATQLLEHGSFHTLDELRKHDPNLKKPTLATLHHASYYNSSVKVPYQLIDDVTQLKSDDDWNRVVGVFVQGPTWQFSDWPKKKWPNPAAIFENVCAFHLHYDDEPLNPNVTQWRTHRLPINKVKRHGDRGLVLDFWHLLTEFVAARNTTKKLAI